VNEFARPLRSDSIEAFSILFTLRPWNSSQLEETVWLTQTMEPEAV
jgi:hypothetical protein